MIVELTAGLLGFGIGLLVTSLAWTQSKPEQELQELRRIMQQARDPKYTRLPMGGVLGCATCHEVQGEGHTVDCYRARAKA